MKKKVIIIIISAVAVCVIAACVLFLTGVIDFPWKKSKAAKPDPELYVEYMNSYMLIDNKGNVIGSVSEPPEGIPKVNGLDFSTIIVGEPLVPQNEEAYAYAKKIVAAIKKNQLPIREVYVSSELEASLYVNDACSFLGVDNKTEEKLNDLHDFIDQFMDLSGTLDMQELSVNNLGYTFKVKQQETGN